MTTFSTATRTVKTRKPGFALGVAGGTVLVRSWSVAGHAFDLIADDLWLDRGQDDAWPFRLHWTVGGVPETKGFDTAAAAEGWAECLVTACPVEFAPAGHTGHFEATTEDRVWWCQQSAPLMPVCGASPEPMCGVSGAWFAPDDDLEPADPELSDDASGAFLGDPA